MENKYLIAGKSVALASLQESDLDINILWMKQNELRHYLERPDEELTPQKQLQWYRKFQNDSTKCVFKIIYLDEHPPKYIGNVTLFDVDYSSLEAEFGVFIGYPEYRRKGLGSEAVRLLIKYVRTQINENIVIRAKLLKDNARAYKVYKKLGFIECKKSDYGFKCDNSVERIYMVLLPGKINHLPENFGFRSKEAAIFPEMVVCGISFMCNSNCIHCPNAATGFTASLNGDDRLMRWGILRKIADECAMYPHSVVRISSCGEVLAHPEAVGMIEYILRVKKDKNAVLTTNGSLLTPDKSLRLLKAGIRAIEISVDAATEETYEKIRRGLRFREVLNNINALVQLRNTGNYKTRIMASVIEQEVNESEIDKIFEFWERLVDEVLIRKLLSFKGIIPRKKHYSTYMPKNAPCPFLWERVLVDAVGNVRGCVSDLYNTSCVGNIKEHNIVELWQSELLNKWRELHLEGKRDMISMCKGCVDLEYRSWTYNYFYALNKNRKSNW